MPGKNFFRGLGDDVAYVFRNKGAQDVAANNPVNPTWYLRAGERFGGSEHAEALALGGRSRAAARADLRTAEAATQTQMAQNRNILEGITDQGSQDYKDMARALEGNKLDMKRHKQTYRQALRENKSTMWDQAGRSWDMFNSGTGKQRALKYGAAAGAYIGLNAAGRLMTGGGITYNGTGERDIMGVPFF